MWSALQQVTALHSGGALSRHRVLPARGSVDLHAAVTAHGRLKAVVRAAAPAAVTTEATAGPTAGEAPGARAVLRAAGGATRTVRGSGRSPEAEHAVRQGEAPPSRAPAVIPVVLIPVEPSSGDRLRGAVPPPEAPRTVPAVQARREDVARRTAPHGQRGQIRGLTGAPAAPVMTGAVKAGAVPGPMTAVRAAAMTGPEGPGEVRAGAASQAAMAPGAARLPSPGPTMPATSAAPTVPTVSGRRRSTMTSRATNLTA